MLNKTFCRLEDFPRFVELVWFVIDSLHGKEDPPQPFSFSNVKQGFALIDYSEQKQAETVHLILGQTEHYLSEKR